MSDWPLPPYNEPRGPAGGDGAVVHAFVRGDIAPHSERLHVEGEVLVVDRDVTMALRMGRRSVLLRRDLPDDATPVRLVVESALGEEGLVLLDEENMLAMAVAVQMVGLRMSTWDIWGADIDETFAALRTAALGGPDDMLLGGGLPQPDVDY